MISENQKEFLKDLENDISEKFCVSKYYVRVMIQALKAQKPQYQIVRLLENKPKKLQDEYNQIDSDHQFCLELEIYDALQKKKIFLEVYFLNDTSLPHEAILKRQVEIVQSIPQTHLLMRPIQSYVLDPLVYYIQDHEFFVVEYDMFDLTLSEFCTEFEVEEYEIEQYIQQWANTCEEISQIRVDLDYLFNYFFVYINQSSKEVQIKLNLIDLVEETEEAESRTYSGLTETENEISSESQGNKRNDFEELEEINREGGIQSEEKREIAILYVLSLRENDFEKLSERDTIRMRKHHLLEEIQNSVPTEIYSSHDPSIFETISEDENYQFFQLNLINKDHFLFKIYRTDKKICYLEGKKVKSLEESQKMVEQYSQMISCNSLANVLDYEKITTLSGIRQINLAEVSYLLIENKVSISKFSEDYQTLDYYQLDRNYQDNHLEEQNDLLKILFKLFELSTQLLYVYEIQITSINPSNIIVVLEETEFSEEKKLDEGLSIVCIDNGNFLEGYVEIVRNIFSKIHSEGVNLFIEKVVKLFFESISRNEQEQTHQIYSKLKNTLSKFQEIKELQYDMNDQYEGLQIFLNLVDDCDQLQKVYAHLKIKKEFDLKDLYQFLSVHQFDHIYLDLKRDYIFHDYDLKALIEKPRDNGLLSNSTNRNNRTTQQSQIKGVNIFSNFLNKNSAQKPQETAATPQQNIYPHNNNIFNSANSNNNLYKNNNQDSNNNIYRNNNLQRDNNNAPKPQETAVTPQQYINPIIKNNNVNNNIINSANKNTFNNDLQSNNNSYSNNNFNRDNNNAPKPYETAETLQQQIEPHNNNIFNNVNSNIINSANNNTFNNNFQANNNFYRVNNNPPKPQDSMQNTGLQSNNSVSIFKGQSVKTALFSSTDNNSSSDPMSKQNETSQNANEFSQINSNTTDNNNSGLSDVERTNEQFPKQKLGYFANLSSVAAGNQPLQKEETQQTGLFSNQNNIRNPPPLINENPIQPNIFQNNNPRTNFNNNNFMGNNNPENIAHINRPMVNIFNQRKEKAEAKPGVCPNIFNTEAKQFQYKQVEIEQPFISSSLQSVKDNQIKQEDISKIQEFFNMGNNPNPQIQQFLLMLDAFLVLYKFKIEVSIEPYKIDYKELVFQMTDNIDNNLDKVNDELIECTQCLSLAFAEKLKNIPIVVKLILTKKSYISIESESPLIGTYYNPNEIDERFKRNFLSAHRFAEFKKIFGQNYDLQNCCEYQQQTSVIFKLFENQKQLSALTLNLEDKQFPICSQFERIQHEYFKNLHSLTFLSSNFKYQDRSSIQQKKIQFYFRYLRSLISQLRKVNSVKFDIYSLDENHKIKLRNQMYKVRYLVSLKINAD